MTCDGLSQWGSQELAQEGYGSFDILRYYYGDDIELVTDAPIQNLRQSYPGYPLRLGSSGPEVVVVQVSLNRIAQNYPAIPKAGPATGVFDEDTENAVREFQRIFGLTPDGVVGKATWYELVSLYVGVTQLAELISEGQQFYAVRFHFPGTLREGDRGGEVRVLQYMLALLAEFDEAIPPVTLDGDFGPATRRAVEAYQRKNGFTVDGVVGQVTWEAIYRSFVIAERDLRRDNVRFPNQGAVRTAATGRSAGGSGNAARLGQYPGRELELGSSDQREVVQV